eukprot:COSAG01_NODE_4967_length_4584_cov_12.666890_4_plen_77_part_00
MRVQRDGDWQWIDGTNMDKKMLNKMKNKYFGDNYQGNNEDEMAYCSASCARQVFKDPKCQCNHHCCKYIHVRLVSG